MTMLDDMARALGLANYSALAAFTPDESGELSSDVIRQRLATTSALGLDPGLSYDCSGDGPPAAADLDRPGGSAAGVRAAPPHHGSATDQTPDRRRLRTGRRGRRQEWWPDGQSCATRPAS